MQLTLHEQLLLKDGALWVPTLEEISDILGFLEEHGFPADRHSIYVCYLPKNIEKDGADWFYPQRLDMVGKSTHLPMSLLDHGFPGFGVMMALVNQGIQVRIEDISTSLPPADKGKKGEKVSGYMLAVRRPEVPKEVIAGIQVWATTELRTLETSEFDLIDALNSAYKTEGSERVNILKAIESFALGKLFKLDRDAVTYWLVEELRLRVQALLCQIQLEKE